jgi:hypothetical protein
MINARVGNPHINANLTHNQIDVKNENVKLVKGEKGAVFTPHVDELCNLSWTNDGGLENPPPVNIKGEHGDATVTPLTNLEIEAIIGR